MVDITKMKISLLLLTLLFISCGKSPLTNKTSGGKTIITQAAKAEVSFTKEDLNIQTYWRYGPELYEENKLLVVFTNAQGIPTDPKLDFHFELDMPEMSHGSYPVTIKRIEQGVYHIDELQFFMPGYWTLNYKLHDNDPNNPIESIAVRVDL